MSEPTAISVVLEPLLLIGSALASFHWSWWFSLLGRLFAFPLKLVLIPLSFIFNFLLVLLSPVLHILSYILSWINAVLAFIASLEPLYTFFGVAAAVGISAGLILGIFSSVVTTQLGMQNDPRQDLPRRSRKGEYIEDSVATHDESSSNEADWQWLEPSPSRRRPAAGLLSQTIHEEDDDSDA